ncbi:MAG TPA: hypothetical protein VFK13_04640 [Gemmatimonadaceae bacterium]|nr:hypothetical protein [Gemmatimonadaceae bacterium]
MASADRDRDDGLLTLVCVTCGQETTYAAAAPDHPVCERCGSTVFRTYFTPAPDDAVAAHYLETTRREIDFGTESPDVTPGDVQDLNNP